MSALGKGLGSLIPNKKQKSAIMSSDFDENVDDQKIELVAPEDVISNPWQPRTHFDRDKLDELAQSIKQHGILQPLVVSKEGDKYQLIAGERRLKAAEILDMPEVPIIIKDVSDRDKLELAIIENIQRRDLNPLETANSYKRLAEEFGLSNEAIAEQVGKGVSTVANFLRLLKLPVVVKEAIAKGDITMSHAKIILSYKTKEEQVKAFKQIIKNDLSVTDLNEMHKKSAAKANKEKPRDPVLASWEDKLTKNIGAKVKIQKRGERGFIKINFHSHSELKNILDRLEE
ncbi:MAG: ParB/RepB/Spo0J family partition protein [Candidatus Komeilibacteria bacterium]|jgi:ParB family transcriptional regulator, chromosome partitioning protein|nr:ParB/RepB/Spo0J family partition protein [Candidatus Komeilibacteria bacterium]MBT4447307.1 ParB/RepB/Spo0J family partition protein [Candidatus Komeilibacteria bacterium]